jgi:ABC-type Fe3+/spermidine/putrescine transport system ATPase subunit
VTRIRIDRVERSFGPVRAVAGVTLDIAEGELFTLLGPSGCGKTTLLRMVAGFCELGAGSIHFGERRIDTLPAHQRNTGMVFQNYAIFPNLRVAENVAYGLKARRVAKAETSERVRRALELVHLADFAERWPHQLSGGQLQRVAIARALVIEPDVLLLDEPLSNLDAKLRVEMRSEIRALQRQLGITAIYVTHDQEEALAISDRIAVMRGGALEQVADPIAIYRHPATPFVAGFMGTTNLLAGTVADEEGGLARVIVGGDVEFRVVAPQARTGERLAFSLRPEALRPVAAGAAAPAGWVELELRLAAVEFLGALTRMEGRLGDGCLLRIAALEVPEGWLAADRPVRVAYDPAATTAFPEGTS